MHWLIGRDPDVLFLADREGHLDHEPGPGGQNDQVFAGRRQDAGAASSRGAKALRLHRCNSPGRFTRLLAIADEETLDLARALLANPPEHIPAQTNRVLRLCRSR